MKTRQTILYGIFAVIFALTFVTCDDGGGGGPGTTFSVTYDRGEGNPPAPTQSRVGYGAEITIPEQGLMTHDAGKVLDYWTSNRSSDSGRQYKPYDKYQVYGDVVFTAQWKVDPNVPVVTNPFIGSWYGTWGNQPLILIFQETFYSWTLPDGGGWGFSGLYTYSGNFATLHGDMPGTAEIRSNGDLILTNQYFGGNNQVICRK